MFKNVRLKKCLLIILTVLISNLSFSQKTSFIKFNLTNEFIKNRSFIPGFGLSAEKRINKHSGAEIGIWYRTYSVKGSLRGGDLFYDYKLNENHFSVPILYKYYSSMIDFSFGPTIDYYGNWTINKNSSGLKVISDTEKKDFGIGFLMKASKDLSLSDRFYLEPEIHFNLMLTIKRNFLGLGLSMKYKL
jgi:hypothetical protein